MDDRNCLSYWFPKLLAAGVPVPETHIIRASKEVVVSLRDTIDLDEVDADVLDPFFERLGREAAKVGSPFFLRTGHTSGKHDWRRTCSVESADDLPSHVMALVESSEMASIIGFPIDVWVVRQLLPTRPITICPAYNGMPVCREFRVFVDDGDVRFFHPYWPRGALEEGGVPHHLVEEVLSSHARVPSDQMDQVLSYAKRAGAALGGSWSVDVMCSALGWMVVDCALAKDSWRDPDYEPTDPRTDHVKYVGPIESLKGTTALRRSKVPSIVQFDDRTSRHPITGALLGFGWHTFSDDDFVPAEEDEG